MKKQLMPIKRLASTLFLGSALLLGTAACSTGTSDGDVNVEESDYKDKSPTEHNAAGMSDNTEDAKTMEDSTNQAIYDQQEDKLRERNSGNQNQGFGGAAETQNN